jgi:hypothetical protein
LDTAILQLRCTLLVIDYCLGFAGDVGAILLKRKRVFLCAYLCVKFCMPLAVNVASASRCDQQAKDTENDNQCIFFMESFVGS